MAAQNQGTLVLVSVSPPVCIHVLTDINAWLQDVALVPPEVLDSMHVLQATRGSTPWHIKIPNLVIPETGAAAESKSRLGVNVQLLNIPLLAPVVDPPTVHHFRRSRASEQLPAPAKRARVTEQPLTTHAVVVLGGRLHTRPGLPPRQSLTLDDAAQRLGELGAELWPVLAEICTEKLEAAQAAHARES